MITIEIAEKAANEASGALQDISVQGQNRMIAINLTIVAGGISKEGHRRTRLVTSGLPKYYDRISTGAPLSPGPPGLAPV